MILIIDNYDSFTYNLYQYLAAMGRDVRVVPNDSVDMGALRSDMPEMIVISPGPGGPESTGQCREVISDFKTEIPILGICLGMQTIAHCFGGNIVHARSPMHGKNSAIRHSEMGLFEGLPNPLSATRYHSLVVERSSLPDCFQVDADTAEEEIMALSHRELPLWGVQFHPEAILTESGKDLLANAVRMSGVWRAGQ
jgi:anthranilate synthase/aminodeoxychorismate synthase-like glutamine amidotransferase